MKRLVIDIENCYGIKSLSHQFDFSDNRAYAIYAQNGAMKSSLAQIFQDIAAGAPSTDRIFPSRKPMRKIVDENGSDLASLGILVVRPYDEEFGHTKETSTLLLDGELRKEYEELYAEIEKAKELLISALKDQSQSRRQIEQEISAAFTADDFYGALHRIRKELEEQTDTPLADVQYDRIFDEKVLAILNSQDVRKELEGYVKRYNELLDASMFFKKGIFDYYNAGQIAKSLSKNGFFDAKHSVHLNARTPKEIHNQKELEAVISEEKAAILTDKELRKKFDQIATAFEKNETLRDFQNYIMKSPSLLPNLSNITKFKQSVWKSYLKVKYDLYLNLISKHESAQKRQREIEAEAARQSTQWEKVIEIFNDRFFVPFKLEVRNRFAVVIGNDPIIDLGFTYQEGTETAPVAKDALIKCLSTGEKRALYILNVIFEIEVRRKAKTETLMIIDDIADSFDYQNKYAIIQYLKDIDEDPRFKQIIMTHNFDFFRTVASRFVQYPQCLMASKSGDGIKLGQATGIMNVFVNDWKKHFFEDPKKKIACIPFIRNLIEFTKGASDPAFLKLTSLLHWKADSARITISDLDSLYGQTFQPNGRSPDGSLPVVDLIQREARSFMGTGTATNLVDKILLAIAIRMDAEKFMVNKINDNAFVEAITSNQTDKLLRKFKLLFPDNKRALETLGRVQLMTPENIHLNSFMYEPIVDMSGEHLRKLYTQVLELN